jgi:SSS family solute:Na+ symporter
MLFVLTPAFIVSPGLLQKAYGAADERAVRIGIGAQALAQLAFAAVPVYFGIAARAASLDIASANAVLPTVLTTQLPPLLGALGLAAVFSAEVSTCDAILFMLATSLSKDLYKRFIAPDADDRRILLVARLAAVAGGLAGMVLAVLLSTIADALRIFYSLLGVSLFVPVVGGLYWRRATTADALASIGAGMGVLLTVRFFTGPIGPFNEELLGLTAAAAAFTLSMLVRASRQTKVAVPRP